MSNEKKGCESLTARSGKTHQEDESNFPRAHTAVQRHASGFGCRTNIYAAGFQTVAGATQLIVKPIEPNAGRPVNVLDADRKSEAYAGFPTVAATHAGDVYVAWLDERDKAEGTSSVYFSRSTDHGMTFNRNMRIAGSACMCCRPQIYVGPSGDIYLAWRQVFEGDVRDMVMAHSTDGGKTFSQPVRVAVDNWVLHACPDVGPAIGVSNGRLYVAWYSEGQEKPSIRLAISENGGASFAAPQIVSADILDATHPRLSVSEAGRILLIFQGRLAHEDTKWRSNQAFIVARQPKSLRSMEGVSPVRCRLRTLNTPFTIPMCWREPRGVWS